MGNLQKLYPNESGILDRFSFVSLYVVSMDSIEEADHLVGWGCKVSLMDI